MFGARPRPSGELGHTPPRRQHSSYLAAAQRVASLSHVEIPPTPSGHQPAEMVKPITASGLNVQSMFLLEAATGKLEPRVPEVDDADPNPTFPEEMDYDDVKRELLRHERFLQRRKKRHASELSAVAEQQEVLEKNKAQLVCLQATADDTNAEIHEHSATIANLTNRQAELSSLFAMAMPRIMGSACEEVRPGHTCGCPQLCQRAAASPSTLAPASSSPRFVP